MASTVHVPEGGRLTAYQGGAWASDAKGDTIAMVRPGSVTDTDGTTHEGVVEGSIRC
ncbi:hypothetical protein ACH4PU_26245 [Streptomyces sp. NPDC021100]|uniref:hypothetical protein n=1 Tax=Streptomyces sp. NPDC021100 TaxID=3365114 RepID=UPI0037AC66D0